MGNFGIRRVTKRTSFRARFPLNSTVKTGSSVTQVDEIMSYRNNLNNRDQHVLPSTADPYGHFLNESSRMKRQQAVLSGAFGSEKPASVDTGHPFWVNHRKVVTSARRDDYRYYGGTTTAAVCFGGPAWATTASLTTAAASTAIFKPQTNSNQVGFGVPVPTPDDLRAFGQHAIGVLAPAKSEVNIFGIIAEFLQGIPRLPFSSLEKWEGIARNGADEFLNFVFGIQPTVGDISKLVGVLTNVSSRLDQLQRDAGSGVRREWTLPSTHVSQEFTGSQLLSQGTIRYQTDWQDSLNFRDFRSQGSAGVPVEAQGVSYTSSVFLVEKESFRFDGSFTYYLPTPEGWTNRWRSYADKVNRLIGYEPTRKVLWNLTPYSWLVDWMVDISAILRTADVAANDSLVVNWAYASRLLERQVIQQTKYNAIDPDRKPALTNVSTMYSVVRKERLRGNPYGFDLQTSANWTPIRFAILAALGISRSPRYY